MGRLSDDCTGPGMGFQTGLQGLFGQGSWSSKKLPGHVKLPAMDVLELDFPTETIEKDK